MVRMSKGPRGETLHAVVLIAFERANGRVAGSFVHGSHEGPDEAGIERSRDRFMKELRERMGGEADLDVLQVPLSELEGCWIERVDAASRSIVKAAPHGRRL